MNSIEVRFILKHKYILFFLLWPCLGFSQVRNLAQLNFDSLMQHTKADTLKIDYAFAYARMYAKKDSTQFFKAYNKACTLLKQSPSYVYGQCSRLYEMANYLITKDLELGLPRLDSALSLLPLVGNKKYDELKTLILVDRGYMQSYLANDEAAIKSYQQAIDLGKTHGFNKYIAMAFNNIAAIYGTKGQFEEQIRLTKQALAYRQIPDEEGKVNLDKCAGFCLSIVGAYSELEKFDSSEVYLQKASKLVFPEHDADLTVYYYFILGNLQAAKQNIAASNASYLKGLAIAQRANNGIKTLQFTVSLGNNYYEEKNYKVAIQYFKAAETYCHQLNNMVQLKEMYKVLYDTYKLIKDQPNAYYYLDKYHVLMDSLQIEANTEEFAELEKKYSLKIKDQELTYFRNLNEINRSAIDKNRIMIAALIGLFLLACLVAYLLVRNQKLVNKTNAEIAQLKISETEVRVQIEKSKAILETQEAERTRIAKDLHDEVGGTLAALKLQLQNQDILQMGNAGAVELVDSLAKNVRQISHNMMPDAIEKFGLKNALIGFISKLNLQSDTVFKYQLQAFDDYKASEEHLLAVYRIIQEILTNALKHARAKTVYVQVYMVETNVSVAIEDDGIGFDMLQTHEGIGLKNIKSRVDFLNASIEYSTSVNKGTSIQIEIPTNYKV